VKVTEASLTRIHLIAESDLNFNQKNNLEFSVGKTNFSLAIIPLSQDKDGHKANILFENYEAFSSWLNFIKVMSLRQSK